MRENSLCLNGVYFIFLNSRDFSPFLTFIRMVSFKNGVRAFPAFSAGNRKSIIVKDYPVKICLWIGVRGPLFSEMCPEIITLNLIISIFEALFYVALTTVLRLYHARITLDLSKVLVKIRNQWFGHECTATLLRLPRTHCGRADRMHQYIWFGHFLGY